MVDKNDKNQQTLSYFDQSNISNGDNNGCIPIAWGATFQVVKQNTRINPKKEMQKLSQEEKDLAILSEKGKLY
jgi:hypothetical protein